MEQAYAVYVQRHGLDSSVSDQDDEREIAELEQLNGELTRSLARCRKLLSDCRSQLAANANMPELLDEDREEMQG